MAKQSSHPDEQQLIIKMLEYEDDPLNFVLFAFPWGPPGLPQIDVAATDETFLHRIV
ncbi:MAG: hypothetical protein O2817_10000 [Proteobacteria bacterium]|nr:hypothetical protein [Pseudomonadota bacterium]